MSDNWYWAKGQQQNGPAALEKLKELAASGELRRSDLVWTEGMSQWTPAEQVPDLFPPRPAPAPETVPPPPAVEPAPGSPSPTPSPTLVQPGYFSPTTAGTPPPNYLVQAILLTCCCCLPFGIPAIVHASQVNAKFYAGDVQGAYQSSKTAKLWAWVAFGVGLGLHMLVWGFQFLIALGGGR